MSQLDAMTVLYVEDDHHLREGLARFLSRRFARVILAENGAEGLRLFEAERPDLLISDIAMPVMDGLSMIARIKELDPDIPVLITTAFSEVPMFLRAIELEVDGYILKPIDNSHLLRSITRVVGRREAERLRDEVDRLEALAILSGGLAHDFNNLLCVILGNLQLARNSQAKDSQAAQCLEVAERTCLEMRDLVRQFVELSSGPDFADPGAGELHFFSPAEAVRAALGAMSTFAPGRVHLDLAEGLPKLVGRPEHLSRALQQILLNADQAMPGEGRIDIRVTCLDPSIDHPELLLPAGQMVRISIADQGEGIAPENLGRIFTPYFTTRGRDSRKGKGLGLSLAQALIRRQGGQILVESTPGKGSVFHVYLPVFQEDRQ